MGAKVDRTELESKADNAAVESKLEQEEFYKFRAALQPVVSAAAANGDYALLAGKPLMNWKCTGRAALGVCAGRAAQLSNTRRPVMRAADQDFVR